MRRLTARSRVLLPAPDGPTTAVMLPPGIPASTPFRISVPPVEYRRPEVLIPSDPMLEHLPAQVGVEPVEDGVGVPGERLVVGENELHTADYGVQPIGLGTAVLFVHEVSVVHDLRDLGQRRIFQMILLDERLERAIVATVGVPGSSDVEELRPLWCLHRVFEEREGSLSVHKTPDQPHAGRAVHVASAAGSPEHQPLSSAPSRTCSATPPASVLRAARKASAASVRKGERK